MNTRARRTTHLARICARALLTAALLLVSTTMVRAQWTDLARIAPEERSNSYMAWLDGRLYVMGGVSASAGVTRSCHVLDIASGTWAPIADLPEARFYGYATAIAGRIYLFGGVSFQRGRLLAVGSVLVYDPASNTWSTKSTMPVPTYYASGALIGSRVYIFGGMNSGNPGSMTQMYEAATDTWSMVETPLPQVNVGSAATAVGATLYLVGGIGLGLPYSSAYRGTITPNGLHITWEPIAPYPTPIYLGGGGTYNGRIYVAGGKNERDVSTNLVAWYDEAGNRWRRGYGLPLATTNNAPNMPGSGNDLYFATSDNGEGRILRYVEASRDPIAVLDRTSLVMTVRQGDSTSASIVVRNNGIVPLTGTLSVPQDASSWLHATATTMMVEPAELTHLTFNATSAALAPGNYVAHCSLATNDPHRPTIPVDVMLVVRQTLTTDPLRLVIEEGAGDWCGNCPEGVRILDYITQHATRPRSIIAYHGGSAAEPMLIPDGQAIINRLGISGYPMAAFNRTHFDGEEYVMTTRDRWQIYVDSMAGRSRAAASIAVDGMHFDGSRLSGTYTVTLNEAVSLSDSTTYAVTVVISEDSLRYTQIEYTDTGTIHHDPWFHQHVARAVFPSADGQPLSFDAADVVENAVMPGAHVSGPFDIGANVTQPDQAHVIVLVHANRGTVLGPIVQAIELPFPRPTSGADLPEANAVLELAQPAPNPAATSVLVTYATSAPGRIALVLYAADGAQVLNHTELAAEPGRHFLDIDLAGLPSGVYSLVLTQGGRIVRRPLTIMH